MFNLVMNVIVRAMILGVALFLLFIASLGFHDIFINFSLKKLLNVGIILVLIGPAIIVAKSAFSKPKKQ